MIKSNLCYYNYAYRNIVTTDARAAAVNTNNSALFKFKLKITVNNGTKHVKIMVPLKYISNFWRIFGMPSN